MSAGGGGVGGAPWSLKAAAVSLACLILSRYVSMRVESVISSGCVVDSQTGGGGGAFSSDTNVGVWCAVA